MIIDGVIVLVSGFGMRLLGPIYFIPLMCLLLAISLSPQLRAEGVVRSLPPEISGYEGFGTTTSGGAGGDVYHVRSLADAGSGTLRDGLLTQQGPRTIVFDVAGTITLKTDIVIKKPFLTLDGASAPRPGITIRKTTLSDGAVIIAGTHDIIVRHLRFWGLFHKGAATSDNAATITIDGDSNPDHIAKNIILDHLTARNATDGGPDIWGEVSDITVSWCLFYFNRHPTTISHYPAPYQTRQRVSMHHNVYAKNDERNPQLRADVRNFDYVNNIVYGWGHYSTAGYGIRIKNKWTPAEPKIHANLINNAFIPTKRPEWALVYGQKPGPDAKDKGPRGAVPTQGTVIASSDMGDLYVSGNNLPAENKDHYSTIANPLPIPVSAQVTTFKSGELATKILPYVGMRYRDQDDQRLIDEVAFAIGSSRRTN